MGWAPRKFTAADQVRNRYAPLAAHLIYSLPFTQTGAGAPVNLGTRLNESDWPAITPAIVDTLQYISAATEPNEGPCVAIDGVSDSGCHIQMGHTPGNFTFARGALLLVFRPLTSVSTATLMSSGALATVGRCSITHSNNATTVAIRIDASTVITLAATDVGAADAWRLLYWEWGEAGWNGWVWAAGTAAPVALGPSQAYTGGWQVFAATPWRLGANPSGANTTNTRCSGFHMWNRQISLRAPRHVVDLLCNPHNVNRPPPNAETVLAYEAALPIGNVTATGAAVLARTGLGTLDPGGVGGDGQLGSAAVGFRVRLGTNRYALWDTAPLGAVTVGAATDVNQALVKHLTGLSDSTLYWLAWEYTPDGVNWYPSPGPLQYFHTRPTRLRVIADQHTGNQGLWPLAQVPADGYRPKVHGFGLDLFNASRTVVTSSHTLLVAALCYEDAFCDPELAAATVWQGDWFYLGDIDPDDIYSAPGTCVNHAFHAIASGACEVVLGHHDLDIDMNQVTGVLTVSALYEACVQIHRDSLPMPVADTYPEGARGLSYAKTLGDLLLIVLDTWNLDAADIAWVGQVLAASGATHKLLALHCAPAGEIPYRRGWLHFGAPPYENPGGTSPLETALFAHLRNFGATLVFVGHDHTFCLGQVHGLNLATVGGPLPSFGAACDDFYGTRETAGANLAAQGIAARYHMPGYTVLDWSSGQVVPSYRNAAYTLVPQDPLTDEMSLAADVNRPGYLSPGTYTVADGKITLGERPRNVGLVALDAELIGTWWTNADFFDAPPTGNNYKAASPVGHELEEVHVGVAVPVDAANGSSVRAYAYPRTLFVGAPLVNAVPLTPSTPAGRKFQNLQPIPAEAGDELPRI